MRAAHAVQWVGRYHPAHRLAPDAELAVAERDDRGRIALQVRGFEDVDSAALQAALEGPVRRSSCQRPSDRP